MEQQDSIVNSFLKEFPELKEHSLIKGDDYSDTPYVFFGVINLILINAVAEDLSLAKKISKWLNTILNNAETNEYVSDMLWIEFFEGSEADQLYSDFLLSHLSENANRMFRQYLYIMENGGLTNAKTGEILKYIKGGESEKTGKYISDIK